MLATLPQNGNGIMPDAGALQRDIVDRQRAMFQLFVGQSRSVTRAALSAATGIPASTLQDWAQGTTIPLWGVLTLAGFLPREAINMVIEPAGFRLADSDPGQACWDGLAAEAASLTADICEARRDGHINHSEEACLRKRTRTLIAGAQAVVDGE